MSTARFYRCGGPSAAGEQETVVAQLAAAAAGEVRAMSPWRARIDTLIARFRHGVRHAILTDYASQITLTRWCRLLGMRVTWLLWPQRAQLRRFSHWRHRRAARRADAVCWSTETAARLERDGYRFRTLTGAALPVDPARFSHQLSLYDELADRSYQQGLSLCYVIGVIMPLVRDCGLEQLLPAVQRLSELIPHLQVIVVGDGPEKKKLQWLSQMLRLQHRVRFVGAQDFPQRWYQFFSITYVPAHALDGIGLRVAESLYAGIPVLASAAEGIQELLGDRDLWLLPAQPTVEQLADAIADLERHADRCTQMAAAARAAAVSRHDIGACSAFLK